VAVAQDRIREKSFLQSRGFATAPFAPVLTEADLRPAFDAIGAPALLKTSRLGYDGKGQATVSALDDLANAWNELGRVECLLERRLALELELSVVLARGANGEVRAFPAGENVHRRGILDTTTVPARVPPALSQQAEHIADGVAEALDYVGVLGVELFVAEGGRLFVNEIAPRPHNSGHYTLDACVTDQFEQQVRALCGLPLGDPRLHTPACMINVLGDAWSAPAPHWDTALALPGVKLHLYGKATPRPGRKMGHLNCLAPTPDEALGLARRAFAALAPHLQQGD
jgi:5-(carboxyamino)imidazole ribonucleotide synthase